MSGQPGRMFADQLGAPPFIGDPNVRCSPETADWFFLDSKVRLAKSLCRQCPRRDDCLRWAIASDAEGVAGGMTADERAAWVRGEPVTPTPARARPSHCGNGHALTDDNTYYPPKRPTEWRCRQCGRDRCNRSAAAKRAAKLAAEQEADAA